VSPYRVALATYSALRELSDDDRPLLAELWKLGIEAEPAVWDDASVDWKRYDAVVIRSTWDYHLSPAAFFAWLARLEALGTALWNPAPVVRANADKSYLRELEARGVSVVPTLWIEKGRPANLDELLASQGWNDAVVKPVISGGAFRTSRVKRGDPNAQAALDDVLAHSNAMVQPFLAEIAAEGEWSFIFLGGEFSHAVLKTVRAGDFRVQEHHGGRTERREPPPALLAQAREAAVAGPAPWLYARVDGIRRGNELVVIELELIEPFLYLAHSPVAARKLAEAVKARLSAAPAPRPSPTTRPPSGGRA
jgi:glutathione synthase/RimK-type ligase-like ATP-grasp enzyme